MTRRVSEREGGKRAMARLRMIQHYNQVTKNVRKTCRFFGISRSQFYEGGLCGADSTAKRRGRPAGGPERTRVVNLCQNGVIDPDDLIRELALLESGNVKPDYLVEPGQSYGAIPDNEVGC